MGEITEMGGSGLFRKFKVMIGSDPRNALRRESPCVGKSVETLRKRWSAVPTGTSVFESTTKLMALLDDALLADGRPHEETSPLGRNSPIEARIHAALRRWNAW